LSLIKIYNLLEKNKVKNISVNTIENVELIKKEEKLKVSITQNKLDSIDKIKKIRINNTLARFNKKQLIELKNNIGKINELINVPEYSSIISLILDGELKASGDENLIFVYTSPSLEQYFNSEIIMIEKILNEVFNVKYKVIAVNDREWDIIKKEFNDCMKNGQNKYVYQNEDFNVEELLNISNDREEFVKNDIDNMFADIVEYR